MTEKINTKPFILHSDFKPSGDQPQAIEKLVENLEDGLAHQTLLGVTGSGKTFTIANVIATLNRPAMLLAPNKTLAAQLYAEMKDFFPENAVEYFVSYYDYYQPEAYVPSSDTFIEKDSAVNVHRRIFFNKSITARNIGFRLVIIIIRNEIFYRIFRKKVFHFRIKLGGESFIWRKQHSRAV